MATKRDNRVNQEERNTTGTVVEYRPETGRWRVEAENPSATGWYCGWQFSVQPQVGMRVRMTSVSNRAWCIG